MTLFSKIQGWNLARNHFGRTELFVGALTNSENYTGSAGTSAKSAILDISVFESAIRLPIFLRTSKSGVHWAAWVRRNGQFAGKSGLIDAHVP